MKILNILMSISYILIQTLGRVLILGKKPERLQGKN